MLELTLVKTVMAGCNGYKLMPPKTYTNDRYISPHVLVAEYLKTIKYPSDPVIANKYSYREGSNKCVRHGTGYTQGHELAQVSTLNIYHSFAVVCQ